MEILGVGSERALSRLCGLFPCRSLRPPIWGILLFDPGEPLPLSGPLASEAWGQGAPRPSQALPRGDSISSRAHAQLASCPSRAVAAWGGPHTRFHLFFNFFRSSILCRPVLQGLHPREALPGGPLSADRLRRSRPEHQSGRPSPARLGAGPELRQHARLLAEREGGAAATATARPGVYGTERASGFVRRADAAGSRGGASPVLGPPVSNYTHADACHRPILRLP